MAPFPSAPQLSSPGPRATPRSSCPCADIPLRAAPGEDKGQEPVTQRRGQDSVRGEGSLFHWEQSPRGSEGPSPTGCLFSPSKQRGAARGSWMCEEHLHSSPGAHMCQQHMVLLLLCWPGQSCSPCPWHKCIWQEQDVAGFFLSPG